MTKKKLLLCLISLLAVLQVSAQRTISIELLPSHYTLGGQGVSAPFCGMVDDRLIIAGGCNFPETPAADGGQKRYYDSIWELTKSGWHVRKSKLPNLMAYGAYVNTDNYLIFIGGNDGRTSLKNTGRINKEKEYPLAPLPLGVDNGAATLSDGYIYLVGGQSDGVPQMDVLRLAYPNGKEWEKIATMPGQARLQPCCVVQTSGKGQSLYIFGGYDPDAKMLAEDYLELDLKTLQWTSHPGCQATAGMTAIPEGYSHVLFFGGVNREIFNNAIQGKYGDEYLRHNADWYKFNPDILVFHTITDSWYNIPGKGNMLARAGAGAVKTEDGVILVDGEVKPGIRGNEIVRLHFKNETHFGWVNWTVLFLYLLAMLGLGFFFMRREGGSDDFFRGGGRIPWWAAGISIYATMLSAITYMAIPAKAYATDWTYYPMLITILIVSFPVIKYYLPYFRNLNITSAYEYLEMRFNAVTRLMASALFIVFMVARMALVLYLPSLALTAVTGIDIHTCIILMGVVTIIYCTMGGVEAVIWGDVVQGIILVGGAIFAVIFLATNTEGGISGCWQIAMDNDKMRLFDWSFDYRSATFWVVIIGGMANNLISYTSDQTVIQRYLTTKDTKSASNSIMMNGIMSAFISVAFYAIGTGLYTFFKTHPEQLDMTMTKGDAIFPYFMMSQMPQGIAGLLIAAIFAATMSTISSNINSISTAFSIDFWKRFRPHTSDKSMLHVARMTCVISGIIGVGIALMMAEWNILSLLDYFNTILGLLSSGLGGLFVMGIFIKRIDGRSALLGFIAGEAVVFALNAYTDVNFLLFGAIGMAVSVIVGYLISLTNKPETT